MIWGSCFKGTFPIVPVWSMKFLLTYSNLFEQELLLCCLSQAFDSLTPLPLLNCVLFCFLTSYCSHFLFFLNTNQVKNRAITMPQSEYYPVLKHFLQLARDSIPFEFRFFRTQADGSWILCQMLHEWPVVHCSPIKHYDPSQQHLHFCLHSGLPHRSHKSPCSSVDSTRDILAHSFELPHILSPNQSQRPTNCLLQFLTVTTITLIFGTDFLC